MISECPHCNQNLRLSDANKERLLVALAKLPEGQTLKFKCPSCKEVVELNPDGFPPDDNILNVDKDLSDGVIIKQEDKPSPQKYANTIPVQAPTPPNPPDISWLVSGSNLDNNLVENILTAMVIVSDQSMLRTISETLKAESYQIYIPQNIDEAISSIRFKDYAIIVYHSRYEDVPLKNQDFHKFMQQMSMQKRRYIYYILIGPEFRTLYDLEALANSSNIVINDNEIRFFPTILTKGKADYKTLFGPYCSMLKARGKS
ncbi:MAG: hypothetical protein HQK69_02325 [Desulfamplus sp.]|nr:hypothetical protein [Desulfamplus sp.]